MRLMLIAVGRAKAGPERDLFDHYCRRLAAPLDLREVEEKKPLSGPELKRREAQLIENAIPDGACRIALDETGKDLSSRQLAGRLGTLRDGGTRHLAFIIGGADGLDKALLASCDLRLSLGRQTWPHMLVRALLAEQVYRAQCIHSGHPYHRD
ncbi:MAG: 23S rRNA (pseudouridine(1915)-N(3))-methyltransferase RlmH [Rhodospirillales bacterium]|nr:23S rRNA (pseudouridine(1915)-N(3))-methyltransferase RlmH [Rhodospirillales bacterium]